jgi:hypothetical protein
MVADEAELAAALPSARAEARLAFGDPTVFLERLVPAARHVEGAGRRARSFGDVGDQEFGELRPVAFSPAPWVPAEEAGGAPRRHHAAWSPVPIGRFGDWQAATHPEGGVTVCYALTFARSSKPFLRGRGDVVLTVAERPRERDAVAISLG